MSISLLYHAFGIVGYIYQSNRYIAGAVIVAISDDRWKLRCSLFVEVSRSPLPGEAGSSFPGGSYWPESSLYRSSNTIRVSLINHLFYSFILGRTQAK